MAINNLIGNIKGRSEDFAGKIKEGKIKEGIAVAAAIDSTKAKMKPLVAEKAKMYEFIGMEIYDLYCGGEMHIEAIEPFCKKIAAINGEIAALELQSAHNCECGQALAAGVKFCPACGRSVLAVATAAIPEQQATNVVTCVCGAVIEEGALMCMECGRRVSVVQ